VKQAPFVRECFGDGCVEKEGACSSMVRVKMKRLMQAVMRAGSISFSVTREVRWEGWTMLGRRGSAARA
jgi:hypothetical protein